MTCITYPLRNNRWHLLQVGEDNVPSDVSRRVALIPSTAVSIALTDQWIIRVNSRQHRMCVPLQPGQQLSLLPHRPAPGHVQLNQLRQCRWHAVNYIVIRNRLKIVFTLSNLACEFGPKKL
jgi:hypothetical protein